MITPPPNTAFQSPYIALHSSLHQFHHRGMLHVVQGRTLTLTLPPTLLLSFSFSLVTLQHALVSNFQRVVLYHSFCCCGSWWRRRPGRRRRWWSSFRWQWWSIKCGKWGRKLCSVINGRKTSSIKWENDWATQYVTIHRVHLHPTVHKIAPSSSSLPPLPPPSPLGHHHRYQRSSRDES